MEKEQRIIGLSRDFIIHPGETLTEVLDDREMSQKELAIRTGMTEKHVSTIVNGVKPISVTFAKKLEYALGIEANFWITLQSNYDREILEFEEVNNISEEEISVLINLKETIKYWSELGWIKKNDNPAAKVLDLRKIMGISDLTVIPNLAYTASYRAQVKNTKVDPYVLFAWQRMCEVLTRDVEVAKEIDIEKLREKIPEIKQVMFMSVREIKKQLEKIFAECGIAFKIVKNFRGAPVQGFIKKREEDKLLFCMTIRNSFADIFWFTLFHEIAHIIHGDTKNKFIDFESVSGESELRADKFAREILIPLKDFKQFVDQEDFSLESIKEFANKCDISSFIVIGRLMKEELIGWECYSNERIRYKWA